MNQGNITKIKFPTKDNDLYEPVEFKNGVKATTYKVYKL